MQKLLLFITSICCWYVQAIAQPNITQAEYYVDNDPGFGYGTSIPVTASTNVVDNTFPVSLAPLQQGMHALFIRSKNANGNWSITNTLFFYKPSAITAAGNVSKAEYYFDNDPGFGFATNIPITAGGNIQDAGFSANVNTLATGIHILFIRSQDVFGKWSVTNQLVFFKKDPLATVPNITKAEYYFDNDPGFGFATNISLTAGTDLQDINFNAAITNLAVGIHILFLRSQDAYGKWSVTNQLVYYKKDPNTTAPNITKAEYYFDNDPGFGFATTIPVSAGVDLQGVNFSPNIQPLTAGLHILFTRSLDALGKWSVTNQLVFYKPPAAGSGITAIEYYYDSEPGFGNGVPVAINEIGDLSDYIIPVNITGLPTGDHKLFMRSKTSNGWSVTNVYTFNVSATAPTPFININSITTKTNCSYDDFRISFHSTGNYLPNNVFTVQLSDATGAFTSPISIGQVTAQTSSIVSCKLPSHLTEGAAYRLRVLSSNTAVTGISSADPMVIHDRPNLGNDTTVFIVCANETLNLLPVYNTTGLTFSWSTAVPTQAPVGNYQLIVTNTYGCRDTAIAIVKQDVAMWTGAISTNWHVAGNWSTGRVPTAKTHVIIPGAAIRACEISDANGVAASLQVRTAGIIRVLINLNLFINGTCNPLPTGL